MHLAKFTDLHGDSAEFIISDAMYNIIQSAISAANPADFEQFEADSEINRFTIDGFTIHLID